MKICRLLVVLSLLILLSLAVSGASSADGRRVISTRETSRVRKHLRGQFGFPLPASARIERVATSASKQVKFICVKMPAADAEGFKKKLIDLRRRRTQRFLYEDKDSDARIGTLPAGEEPASIEAWKTENKFTGGETMIYIQNVKQIAESEFKSLSYLVMFSQESTGLAYFYYYPAKR